MVKRWKLFEVLKYPFDNIVMKFECKLKYSYLKFSFFSILEIHSQLFTRRERKKYLSLKLLQQFIQ